jgi:hydroxyacylglutathione hydrolase
MSVEDVDSALAGGAVVVDLRQPAAHVTAHVPGSMSIPSGSSFGTWLGWVVEPERPLVLVLDDPADWDDAVRQALRIGNESILGHLRGGLLAWQEAGRPIAAGGRLNVDELAGAVARGGPDAPLVVDVRQLTEYVSGHVPGSWHIAAGSLPDRLGDLPRDRPIATICASGYRASVAASLLRGEGFTNVSWVADGIPAWQAQGHPIKRGGPPGGAEEEVATEAEHDGPALAGHGHADGR